MKGRFSTAVLIAGALVFSASGSAQQRGIVNVDITQIKPLIARNLGVPMEDIQDNVVRVPLPIAADVCGVTEDFFARRTAEEPICTAKGTSELLDEHIRQLIES